jgi:superfamily I DNA/RNA helicase
LTTCFRCPTAHIEKARRIVPDIKAVPNAPVGVVQEDVAADFALSTVEPGDLVMARSNPALVKFAFQLLKRKVAVKIIGETVLRDDLEATLAAHAGKTNAELRALLPAEEAAETRRLIAAGNERAVTFAAEMYRCIREMAREAPESSVDALLADVKRVFDAGDIEEAWEANAVQLSSVHRAKGKTKSSAWILTHAWIADLNVRKRKKRSIDKQEELNMLYIAVTRSTGSLAFVGGSFELLLAEINA